MARPSRAAAKWDAMSRGDYLRALLMAAHKDLEQARRDKSHQAVASLLLRVSNLREQLDAELKAAVVADARGLDDPTVGLSPAELALELRRMIAELPESALGEIEEAILERRGGPPKLMLVSS